MCAILDANVVGQVFGRDRPSAGRAFFDWLQSDNGRLVAGGQLREELDRNSAFVQWCREAVLAGRVTLLNDDAINSRTEQLKREDTCRSDDEHIVAVAQMSGARLLFTNDKALQGDFKNRVLIDQPRGRVYTTLVRGDVSTTHRQLLSSRNLCGQSRR